MPWHTVTSRRSKSLDSVELASTLKRLQADSANKVRLEAAQLRVVETARLAAEAMLYKALKVEKAQALPAPAA